MGTVIYSAGPLQAFLGSLGTILFIFAIGLVGIGIAIFRGNQGRNTRLLTGALGVFLLIVSCVYAAFTLFSVSAGTRTVTVLLGTKTIANDNCGDNGDTCTRYVLEGTTSSTAFDFDVPQAAYDKAQLNTCYKFTYYPNKGLFASEADAYQRIDNIARIETAAPSSCR